VKGKYFLEPPKQKNCRRTIKSITRYIKVKKEDGENEADCAQVDGR
jgi:hypothetical protein